MSFTKEYISLREGARISGYNQDYLGYLIRRGELAGQKIGRNWVTTEAAVRKYVASRSNLKRNSLAALLLVAVSGLCAHFITFVLSEKETAEANENREAQKVLTQDAEGPLTEQAK
jgi:hypothetical protein